MYFIKPLYHTFLCYGDVLSENNPEAIKCIDNNKVYDNLDNADFIALLFDNAPRRINIPAEMFLTVADIDGSVISRLFWDRGFPASEDTTTLLRIDADSCRQSFTWFWKDGDQEVEHPLNQDDLIWLCEYLAKRDIEMNTENRSNDEMKKDNVKIGMSVLHENNYSVPVDADNVDALLDEIIGEAITIAKKHSKVLCEWLMEADFILVGKGWFDSADPYNSLLDFRRVQGVKTPIGWAESILVSTKGVYEHDMECIKRNIRNDIKEHASIYFSNYDFNELDDRGFSATVMTYSHTPERKYSFTLLDTSKLKEYFGVES